MLCSTAQRTRETLDGLKLGAVPVKHLDALYHASTNVLLETLHEEAVGKSVLIITHNPAVPISQIGFSATGTTTNNFTIIPPAPRW